MHILKLSLDMFDCNVASTSLTVDCQWINEKTIQKILDTELRTDYKRGRFFRSHKIERDAYQTTLNLIHNFLSTVNIFLILVLNSYWPVIILGVLRKTIRNRDSK